MTRWTTWCLVVLLVAFVEDLAPPFYHVPAVQLADTCGKRLFHLKAQALASCCLNNNPMLMLPSACLVSYTGAVTTGGAGGSAAGRREQTMRSTTIYNEDSPRYY